jgi:predicted aspartyl protease
MIARAFAFAALLVTASAAFAAAASPKPKPPDPRAWPATYETAQMTAKELLAAAKKADGTLGEGKHTLRMSYTFHDGGLEGTEREVWSGDDYRVDVTTGPFLTAEGKYQGQLWETNENGYTLLKRGIHQRAEANVRALEKPDPGDDVAVLGRLHAPADVYVLRVSPPDGRAERRFYDATSFRLVRRETKYLDSLVVTTYEDYRSAHGVTLPYRTTLSDGHPENDKVWTIGSVAIDGPVADGELSVPGSRRIPVTMPAGVASVRLPARIDEDGHIIIRLMVNGRGLDFQLDSGSAGIVLDRDVARQLGLKTYGRWSQTVAGTFIRGHAVVPKLEIGTILMNDVVVEALPFSYANDMHTKVVGLLGYDFIAGCVVKIDYVHGTVDAIPSESFEPPKNAFVLDAILDDQVPMVGLRVNDVPGERFILDTGADDVVLFSAFARKHPAAVDDHSPHKIISRIFNLVAVDGVGGKLTISAVLLEKLQLGSVMYPDWLAMVMKGDQPAFEGEDDDGLIGASMLKAFDVYLDYANSRVALVPNANTHKATPPPASAKPASAKPASAKPASAKPAPP